jgi:hypothetical protein
MEEPWMPEKHNIMFEDDEKVAIILSYNWSSENKPSSMFIYWGNEKYREVIWDFHSNKFGKDKIETYWKNILELDKNKKLTLDTLCDSIENNFIPADKLKDFKKRGKSK